MTNTNALVWIRKSKGSDDDIGLEIQRRDVPAVAEEIADEYDVLDIGVHSGWSNSGRPEANEQLLDENQDVLEALKRVENGEFDYIVAWDDRRICRDGWMGEIKRRCNIGNCTIVYVSDAVPEDELTYGVKREIDKVTKQIEIQKAIAAINERMSNGLFQGTPPFGLQFDKNSEYLEPDDDQWDAVAEIVAARESGRTLQSIADEFDTSIWTVRNLAEQGAEERYEYLLEYLEEYGDPSKELPSPLDAVILGNAFGF